MNGNGNDLDLLANEWCNGVLINPFWLIDDRVFELCLDMGWRDGESEKTSSDVCAEIAEIFLECTSYRVTENEIMREGEKAFMAAMFCYLYCEAPPYEQNLSMLCELVRADIAVNYSNKTDLQRLFDMFAEKNEKHESIKHFEAYLANLAGRGKIIKSLTRRLSPLFSFYTGENANIFENCGASEIFDMGVALLHNLGESLAEPHELENKKDEIAFVVAVLHLIHNAYPANEQTAGSFYKLINNPVLLESQIKEHPDAFEAKKYWSICRKNILKGNYDKDFVSGIKNFFRFKT